MASQNKDTSTLAAENQSLRTELSNLRNRMNAYRQGHNGAALVTSCPASFDGGRGRANSEGSVDEKAHLSIIVLGASGDLAVKKTYPALFALYRHKLLPANFTIVGYARSGIPEDEFRKKISSKFSSKFPQSLKDEFLARCWYVRGQYDSADDFAVLDKQLLERELKDLGIKEGAENAPALNRIFYMALPPTAFVPAAKSLQKSAMTKRGWNRVVVEKPFGRDTESSEELGRELSALFSEDQLYRIDHYLGKEMVQNLMVLRFANKVFEPLFNRDHINCVQITFKEDFGTQGRGGYFDHFGIIRDVMQNHLLQILSIVAMEPPVSMSAEDVRDEKVKLLRSIAPITVQDTVIGQYTADPKGREGGYLDDPEVPNDSVTPTYAASVLHINNSRWLGVPFIMKSGKALNEKKADIRIQFKHPINSLFDDVSPNELVLRVGPDEAVYLKMTTKEPGLDGGNRHSELDLTYKKRFEEEMKDMPDAYERLILDVIRGDHNLFVRADELAAAWRIFTPLLHAIENDKALKPIKYEFGSRGPVEADSLLEQYGYVLTSKYKWEEAKDAARPAGACAKVDQAVINEFVRLMESTTAPTERLAAFGALFTPNGVVESPLYGVQPARDFYVSFLPTVGGVQLRSKHKLVDPSQPNVIALHFSGAGEVNGKSVQIQTLELVEVAEDGKIKKITHMPGPQAKL